MIARHPAVHEMPTVFAMGYDTWGDGLSLADHISRCSTSSKYPKGTWYVLDVDGELVCTLICYQDHFRLPAGYVGIGSVATAPKHRKRRFASTLIQLVMAQVSQQKGVHGFALYSDVAPAIYERLGFVQLPAKFQRYPKSIAMLTPLPGVSTFPEDFVAPDYF